MRQDLILAFKPFCLGKIPDVLTPDGSQLAQDVNCGDTIKNFSEEQRTELWQLTFSYWERYLATTTNVLNAFMMLYSIRKTKAPWFDAPPSCLLVVVPADRSM